MCKRKHDNYITIIIWLRSSSSNVKKKMKKIIIIKIHIELELKEKQFTRLTEKNPV